MTRPTHGYTRNGAPVHAHTHSYLGNDSLIGRFNARFGLNITKTVGTMWCAYFFAIVAFSVLPSVIHLGTTALVLWFSSEFTQLVLLPIIIVGQNIQNQASDARAEKTFADVEAANDKLTLETNGGITQLRDELIAHIDSKFPAVKPARTPRSTK